jgi:hypothetical protein
MLAITGQIFILVPVAFRVHYGTYVGTETYAKHFRLLQDLRRSIWLCYLKLLEDGLRVQVNRAVYLFPYPDYELIQC